MQTAWSQWFASIHKVDWECLLKKRSICSAHTSSLLSLNVWKPWFKRLTPFEQQSGHILPGKYITIHRLSPIPLEKIFMSLAANITEQQWSLWLSNTMGGNTLEIYILPLMKYASDHNVHQTRERVQFYTKGCKCVDVLGSTTLWAGMSKSTQRYRENGSYNSCRNSCPDTTPGAHAYLQVNLTLCPLINLVPRGCMISIDWHGWWIVVARHMYASWRAELLAHFR